MHSRWRLVPSIWNVFIWVLSNFSFFDFSAVWLWCAWVLFFSFVLLGFAKLLNSILMSVAKFRMLLASRSIFFFFNVLIFSFSPFGTPVTQILDLLIWPCKSNYLFMFLMFSVRSFKLDYFYWSVFSFTDFPAFCQWFFFLISNIPVFSCKISIQLRFCSVWMFISGVFTSTMEHSYKSFLKASIVPVFVYLRVSTCRWSSPESCSRFTGSFHMGQYGIWTFWVLCCETLGSVKILWRMWIQCFVLASSQPSEVQTASSIPPLGVGPGSVRFSEPLLSPVCLSPAGTFQGWAGGSVAFSSVLKASAVLLWVCPTRTGSGWART